VLLQAGAVLFHQRRHESNVLVVNLVLLLVAAAVAILGFLVLGVNSMRAGAAKVASRGVVHR
jgi:hypothetical protein